MSNTAVQIPPVLVPFYLQLEKAAELLFSASEEGKITYIGVVDRAFKNLYNAKDDFDLHDVGTDSLNTDNPDNNS